MSEGMLGTLPLSETRGPRNDLEEKLASAEGREWLEALKKFLRREHPWPAKVAEAVEEVAPPIERWRRLSDTAIEVDLDAPLQLPFRGAEIEWQPPAGRGWVKVERIGDDLFVGGRKIIPHLEPEQKTGTLQGHKLRKRLQNCDTLDPRILDVLVEFEGGRLIPESLKQDQEGRTLYHYFWAVGFQDRGGRPCVRSLYWFDGQWQRRCLWLDRGWGVQDPTLLLASPSA